MRYVVDTETYEQAATSLTRASALLSLLNRTEALDQAPSGAAEVVLVAIDLAEKASALLGDAVVDTVRPPASPPSDVIDPIWDAAEKRLADALKACLTVSREESNETHDRLGEELYQAQLSLIRLAPRTMRQALRRIEIATTGGELKGADIEELVAEAKGLLS